MINFKKVRFKNFGSFGNTFTEIQLDRHSMTLVSGCNGHGKSFALLDSITFGLFGKPFRKINIPQLINSINRKNLIVEIEFEIANDSYKVVRGIKPKKFEIYRNDELLDQNAKSKDYQKMLEEQILKMNYKSFTQVVILGSSSFVPFMQLSVADRRSVIEDILDINVFSIMNMILKSRISTCREEQRDVKFNIEVLNEKIDLLESHIRRVKQTIEEGSTENEKEITDTRKKIKNHQSKIDELRKQSEKLQNEITSYGDLKSKIQKVEVLKKQLESNKRKAEEGVLFFEMNEVCPTCTQDIDSENTNVVKTVDRKKDKIVEIDDAMDKLSTHYEEIAEQSVAVDTKLKEISSIEEDISSMNGWVSAAVGYMEKLVGQTENIKKEKDKITEETGRLASYREEMVVHESENKSLVEDMYYYEVASTLLKDSGIKAKIIKHYLPMMNKLINKHLASMDFFAQFTLDEEFNETIKSRHRDDFSYMSFSEGEKMRIDLALLLSWREIARLKNSANTNLLILDEVFDSSLDTFGTDEFLKLLNSLSQKANVFVISHKADQLADKFSNQMSFEKQNNFSKMSE